MRKKGVIIKNNPERHLWSLDNECVEKMRE